MRNSRGRLAPGFSERATCWGSECCACEKIEKNAFFRGFFVAKTRGCDIVVKIPHKVGEAFVFKGLG